MDLKKRILSLVLALALVLSCVGAFAEEATEAKPIKEIKELKVNQEKLEYHWNDDEDDQLFSVTATLDPADTTESLRWEVSGAAKLADDYYYGTTAWFIMTEPGKATVTATAYDGKALTKVSKSIDVTIEEVKPTKLDITTNNEVTIEIGESIDLLTGWTTYDDWYWISYNFTPEDASYGDKRFLTFSGTNDTVDVSTFGTVFGKKAGTATITAKTFKGAPVEGTIKVKVVEPDGSKITNVSFNDKKHSFKLADYSVDMKDYVIVQPDAVYDDDGEKLFMYSWLLNWKVDNTSIATINQNGILTFKKAGQVEVTAYYGDIKDTCTVTITAPEKFDMSFAQSEVKVKLGDSIDNELILPSGATYDDFSSEVGDSTIATVSDVEYYRGSYYVTVYGLKNGTTTVTVKAYYDGAVLSTASFTVVVDDEGTLLSDVSFKKDLYELPYGKTWMYLDSELVFTPENYTLPAYSTKLFSVSDPTIASIEEDEYGIYLLARQAGKVKVTFTVNGTLTATTTVVIDTIALEKVKFQDKKYVMGYSESGDKPNHTYLEIEPLFTPAEATIKNVKFESTNANVATAVWALGNESSCVQVQANGIGKAVITAYFDDGVNVKEASFTVVVTDKITKVTLNKTKKTLYMKPKALRTYQLVAKDATTRAKLGADMIKWKSSNKKVATVDATGLVTAKGVGTCTITATVKDKIKKTATCKITVLKKKNLK